MSMYGDSGCDNLYEELKRFLEDYPVTKLIQIVTDVIRDEVGV